jgi:hypothetical protein
VVAAGFLLSGLTARFFVWPVPAPMPDHVDAIVKLGGYGDREDAALTLAAQHRAPVLIDSTLDPLHAGFTGCLPAVEGVEIVCFNPVPPTTRGEARYVGRLAELHGWRSIVLVTTPDQAWRARLRMRRCFDGAVYSVTTPLRLRDWAWEIPYQWAATVKALVVEPTC